MKYLILVNYKNPAGSTLAFEWKRGDFVLPLVLGVFGAALTVKHYWLTQALSSFSMAHFHGGEANDEPRLLLFC